MTRVMRHRGPDDEGLSLINPRNGASIDLATDETADGVGGPKRVDASFTFPHTLALGHRRFSIIDPSPSGHQPFWSRNREVCLTMNGELYNYVELRDELETFGHRFRTTSDTEVMAAAYLQWSERALDRFIGFYALALYDSRNRGLLLARDRIGKAPLYVLEHPTGLYWASEIKSLQQAVGSAALEVSAQAVTDFVLHGYRDVDHSTFYSNVVTFPSASYGWARPEGVGEARRYWELPRERWQPSDLPFEDATRELSDLLVDALRIRMRADVPVGFELSGGMDSSALVALAASRIGKPMEVFTVSWPGSEVDEEVYARQVAEQYASVVNYNILTPPQSDFFEQVDDVVWMMEQPFRTPSALTYQTILGAMRKNGMRVSINGLGGDENFAGYGLYRRPYLRHLLRNGKFVALLRAAERSGDVGERLSARQSFDRFRHLAQRALENRSPGSGRRGSSAGDPFSRVLRLPAGIRPLTGPSPEINQLLIDYMTDWQMNYWQRVVNQSSMAIPVEVRSPLLDQRIVEFSFQLPLEYILKDGWTKWIFRHATADVLPEGVTWRRVKQGFPFPHDEWLATNRDVFFRSAGDVDCPYVDLGALKANYEQLRAQNPIKLWRTMSLALWWKRCVQGDSLLAAA